MTGHRDGYSYNTHMPSPQLLVKTPTTVSDVSEQMDFGFSSVGSVVGVITNNSGATCMALMIALFTRCQDSVEHLASGWRVVMTHTCLLRSCW